MAAGDKLQYWCELTTTVSANYANLGDTPFGQGWQKNTGITLLARLGEKGLVTAEKLGRRNRYTAAVTEAEYQAAQTRSLLDKLYQGEARGLVLTLLEQQLLSPEDYDELHTLWDQGKEKL